MSTYRHSFQTPTHAHDPLCFQNKRSLILRVRERSEPQGNSPALRRNLWVVCFVNGFGAACHWHKHVTERVTS